MAIVSCNRKNIHGFPCFSLLPKSGRCLYTKINCSAFIPEVRKHPITKPGMNTPLDPEAERKPDLHAQNELDALLSFLSHDLRAPLRGIDGYSQALIEDYSEKLDPMARAYLEYIHASSRNLSEIIDGLLKFYRIGRSNLSFEKVNLSDLFGEIAGELWQREPQRIVHFKIAPDLMAQADRGLMTQLLSCLVDNALKFTSNQHETHIEFGSSEKANERVFFVSDNGAGFQMAYQERLFQPFQRLHGQHEYPGFGLGLAIAHKIVALHNGQIWAEAEPDKGATFFFTIPQPGT